MRMFRIIENFHANGSAHGYNYAYAQCYSVVSLLQTVEHVTVIVLKISSAPDKPHDDDDDDDDDYDYVLTSVVLSCLDQDLVGCDPGNRHQLKYHLVSKR